MARPFANATWLWDAIDWLGDKTAIPESKVHTLWAGLWGWGSYSRPDLRNIEVHSGTSGFTDSLYYNGVVFLRISAPFDFRLQVRVWPTWLFQCGLGWKGNGRFAPTLRFQTDASAAVGMDGPNYGQASGFQYGPH